MEPSPKIIVFDDDPTGSQTVHSCLLLLHWDVDTLCQGLLDASPLLFILTNTRAHSTEDTARITREVCRNLEVAIATLNLQHYLIISRSDSTLRGHYPLETDVITAEMGPFDAQFLVPAFLEGGRITLNSTHYLQNQDQLIPVHETEFAQDPVFGYHHSYLPDFIAEKTQNRTPADQVVRITPTTLANDPEQISRLIDNQYGVVDAVTQADLDQFSQQILQATQQGHHFLFRSAASLITAFAHLPPQPIPPNNMGQTVQHQNPGVFIVGSYVQTTTTQLNALMKLSEIEGIEIDLNRLQDHEDDCQAQSDQVLTQLHASLQQGHTPVIYTSRQALNFAHLSDRLRFGALVSGLFADIVQQLPTDIGYLVSKGGITSNQILAQGLNLAAVRLLGQILPGCCVVQTADDHPFSQLPIVLFPGNVGQPQDLVTIYQRFMSNSL